ncbi:MULTISPECIES: hypothetical protein [Clostridiaceae]|uniref:Uncharacterized protein n=1 Tax=Clostridium facile TaxID=2763035 RepID=A0ABR7IPH0_9CLOT|nr:MULTISPECIES: hypothetical protein [Clostridiaceae]MBC5786762.1 hypothetical protein [Clostridium facile]
MNKETIFEMYQEGRPVKEIAEQVRRLENITSKKAEAKVVGVICAHKLAGKRGEL